VTTFRYSDEERAAILAHLPIDDDEGRKEKLLDLLERAADRYVSTSAARSADVQTAREWAEIARHAAELKRMLEGMGDKLDYRFKFLPTALTALEVDASVASEMTEKHGVFASAKRSASSGKRAHQPKQAAKVASSIYYEEIFIVWLTAGGSLAVSAKDKRVYGPFVRYLDAVALPVLQSEMPAKSSIPALVRLYNKTLTPELGRQLRTSFLKEHEAELEGIYLPF
jgi:hypothetical protein